VVFSATSVDPVSGTNQDNLIFTSRKLQLPPGAPTPLPPLTATPTLAPTATVTPGPTPTPTVPAPDSSNISGGGGLLSGSSGTGSNYGGMVIGLAVALLIVLVVFLITWRRFSPGRR
jgi:hypothetical protein